MRKSLTILLVVAVLLLMTPGDILAKRLLPQAKQPATKSTKTISATTDRIKTSVKFRGDRLGLVATLSNLEVADKVSYSLTYTQRGIQEGAGGSLTDLSGAQTRELLFGTCSHGVCRYHSGIKNARFVVTTTLKNGKKVSKLFRLKI